MTDTMTPSFNTMTMSETSWDSGSLGLGEKDYAGQLKLRISSHNSQLMLTGSRGLLQRKFIWVPIMNPSDAVKASVLSDVDEKGLRDDGSDESESYQDSDTTGPGEVKSESEKEEVIAKDETIAVLRLKLVVLLVLVLSAVGVALSVYFYTSGSEQTQFEQHFVDASHKVLEAIGSTLDTTMGSFDGIVATLVSTARDGNHSWPFVTLPNFAFRMSKVLPLSNAIYLSVYPVVTPAQRQEWEEYSFKNQFWVNESMAVQETWKGYHGPVIYDWVPDPVIHGNFGPVPYNERYVVLLI